MFSFLANTEFAVLLVSFLCFMRRFWFIWPLARPEYTLADCIKIHLKKYFCTDAVKLINLGHHTGPLARFWEHVSETWGCTKGINFWITKIIITFSRRNVFNGVCLSVSVFISNNLNSYLSASGKCERQSCPLCASKHNVTNNVYDLLICNFCITWRWISQHF